MDQPVAQITIRLEGDGPPRVEQLYARSYLIGSSSDADIELKERTVQKRHATLEVRSDGATLISHTGGESLPIGDGDEFRIGPFTLTYELLANDSTSDEWRDQEPAKPAQSAPTASQPPDAPLARTVHWIEPGIRGRHIVTSAVSKYLDELPPIYQSDSDSFLGRFLKIFESIWEPFEQRQDHIHAYFDPRTCPPVMLAFLEHWLAVPFSSHWPEARRRLLLTIAFDLHRMRGTQWALECLIEVYTGVPPRIEPHPTEAFVIRIAPGTTLEDPADRAVVAWLVETFKPAHVAYELVWSEQL